MFELFIALKYLLPKKRSLSTALISLISMLVISLVVWLVLVFLSVTNGIEKRWVEKLTSLNAPIRITPSKENPFFLFEEQKLQLKTILSDIKKDIPDLQFQEFEISGALLKLFLQRQDEAGEKLTYLSQMSYLLSFSDQNPQFPSLLLPPSIQDLDSMMHTMAISAADLIPFFKNIHLKKVITKPYAHFPLSMLSKNISYPVYARIQNATVIDLVLASEQDVSRDSSLTLGTLLRKEEGWHFQTDQNRDLPIHLSSFRLSSPLIFSAKKLFLDSALEDSDRSFFVEVEGKIQNHPVSTSLPLSSVQIYDADTIFSDNPMELYWAISNRKKIILPEKYSPSYTPILLPKSLQVSGARIGDKGTLSYAATTITSPKEQRLAITVAGFYDPGLLPVGNKFLIVPIHIAQTINASNMLFLPDGTPTNGIYIWFSDLAKTKKMKTLICEALNKAEVTSLWNVDSFHEYEFSKDLIDQFQSDRTLFTLIAIIILIVSCSNIISFLILLVKDKKKEIAILQAMGASKVSIASIFGICGIALGLISSALGSLMAIITLRYLNGFVHLLSIIQGHSAFNPSFFGKTLPNELSYSALMFILIATPLIALISGLIPAIKAARLHPSNILRSSE